jgi:hypothetical protein
MGTGDRRGAELVVRFVAEGAHDDVGGGGKEPARQATRELAVGSMTIIVVIISIISIIMIIISIIIIIIIIIICLLYLQ